MTADRALLPKCSGLCRGGPYDGKPLYHAEPSFRLAYQHGKLISWCGPATDEITIAWYQFRDGEWIFEDVK